MIEARRRALDDFVKFIASNEHLYCHTSFTRFVTGSFSSSLSPHSSTDNGRFSDSSILPSSPNTPTMVAPSIQAPPSIPSKSESDKFHPPKNREVLNDLGSPLSSSIDSELEGDSLPFVWESIDPSKSKITSDIQAAKNFSREGHWKDAFRCYKMAASNLLKELKSDSDRKEENRCLLSACLAKAEYIHREYLLHTDLREKREEEDQNRSVWMVSLSYPPLVFRSP